ncbi:MAG: MarR family winged helix-turn-helix transcriptional regulator [Salibacteraceae bacterium]
MNLKFPERLNNSLGYLLNRAGKAMGGKLNRNFKAAGFEVNLEHWVVFAKLWREDGQNQQELGLQCMKDKATMTRLIDHMEKQGWLARTPDPEDRRSRLIHTTKQGTALREQLLPVVFRTLDEAATGISADELEICKRVLAQLHQNLCQEPQCDPS